MSIDFVFTDGVLKFDDAVFDYFDMAFCFSFCCCSDDSRELNSANSLNFLEQETTSAEALITSSWHLKFTV